MRKKTIALLLTAVLTLATVTPVFADEDGTWANQIYRNETTYKLDNNGNPADDYGFQVNGKIVDINKSLKKDENLISFKTVQVYVNEEIDPSTQKVTDSHLMTNKEVKEYLNTSKTAVAKGSDTATKYLLTIELSVTYNSSKKQYACTGTADWDGYSLTSGSKGPALGDDFIAVTWGGEGELKSSSKSISGTYNTNVSQYKNITFAKAQSDTYAGYCWSFPDMLTISSTGKTFYADALTATQVLKKTYTASQGKETNVKLTYIHTYEQASGSISFTLKDVPSVTLSNVDKQWQIECDVPGVSY